AKEILWGAVNNPVVINEYGHQFYVDVMEGQKTGFFLDQRENRRLISNFSKGKKVLNCFSYSGGFSVYAAKQGAITTSVDVSAPALELAQQNFQLNHLSLEGHNFVKANVFEFLREDKERYDVVILDPPAFAKQKKDVMKASRGYKDINRLAMEKFNEEGLLLTCSCSSFIDRDLFRKIIFAAAKEANCRAQILAQTAHPIDHPISVFHPEGEYLKALLLRITR
ncbi:MAG: class I SAM-dependent rRNA methyltransferase, partial [Calditrichaeota bacterium]